MMKKIKKLSCIILVLLLAFAVAIIATACGGETDSVTLSSITLDTSGAKTEYEIGDKFSSTGLSVTANYSDGTSEKVTGFTVSSPNMTTSGEKIVTVTYQGQTATYKINIAEVCSHQCPECGLCMDYTSALDSCAEKCGDSLAESYTFESENSRVVTTSGTMGGVTTFIDRTDHSTNKLVSGRGNFSSNSGASLTFKISAPETTTVTLLVRVSRGTGGITTFTDVALPVFTNSEGDVELISRSTRVERTTTGTWFDFQEVNLGCITLTEGVNNLMFAPTGTAYNFDYIAMLSDEVLTWSDGKAADIIGTPRHGTGPYEPEPPTPVGENINTGDHDDSAWASYTFNAHIEPGSSTLNEGIVTSSGLNAPANRANAAGYYPIGNLDMAKGKFVTFYIDSSAETVVGLYMELGNLASKNYFYDWLDLKVNGTDYTSDAAMPVGTIYTPSNTYTCIGFVTLKEGNNIITFTVNNTAPQTSHNIYGLKFTAASATIDWGVVEEPEPPTPVGENINTGDHDDSAWAAFAFNSYSAAGSTTLSDGVVIDSGLTPTTGRPNEAGYYPIGNLDGNKGKSVTFYIDSSAETAVGLYMELGNLDVAHANTFGDWLDLTLNATKYTSDADMPVGERYTPSNTYTLIGFITLKAGNNTVIFTVNSAEQFSAHNIYGLQFTAESATISWGEEVEPEPEPEPDPGPKNINTDDHDDSAWTAYQFTSYNAASSSTLSEGVTISGGITPTTNRPNNAGYYPLGNLDGGKGKWVKFFIDSSEEAVVGMYMELGNLDEARKNTFDDWLDFTLNGKKYTSDADMPFGTLYTPSNTYALIGFVTLQAGNNILSFTINTSTTFTAHNIYGLQFTAESATISWGEEEKLENINTGDYDDGAWTEYAFNAHSAASSSTLSSGVVTSDGLSAPSNRANDDGYYPIGGLDGQLGKFVTFYIDSSAEATVGLYMEVGKTTSLNTFGDWLDLTVNGHDYTSDAAMPYGAGENYFPSNTYVIIGFITLQAGNNTITFTINNPSVGSAHNIYGIQFTAESATISWGTPA